MPKANKVSNIKKKVKAGLGVTNLAGLVVSELLPYLTAIVGKTSAVAARLATQIPADIRPRVVTVQHVHALEVPEFDLGNQRDTIVHFAGTSSYKNSERHVLLCVLCCQHTQR